MNFLAPVMSLTTPVFPLQIYVVCRRSIGHDNLDRVKKYIATYNGECDLNITTKVEKSGSVVESPFFIQLLAKAESENDRYLVHADASNRGHLWERLIA